MLARRTLVLTLAVAMQLLAWREVVPACVSMAHCAGMPENLSRCDQPTTIAGTADCCKSGSVAAPTPVSPMPQRAQTVTPVLLASAFVVTPPSPMFAAERGRAAADTSPPLPPLLSSCILRI